MHERSKTTRILGTLLVLIGIAGLLLVVGALLLFSFFAYGNAPEFQDFLLIALPSLPFCFYLYAIKHNWTREVALIFGIPVHLAWTPLLRAMIPHRSVDDFLWTIAVYAVVIVYVSYALSLPRAESRRSDAD